ncbi:MAG: hypothetical protein IKX19_11500, partial [Clostridia bacterium]|nr:hypothetical protein [Clostridia bacterium]
IMMYCLNKDRAESDDPDTAYALFRSDRAAGIAAAILDESSRKFGSMKELERSLCDAKKSMPS